MYVLNLNFINKKITIEKITDTRQLSYHILPMDEQISMELQIPLNTYRDLALKQINLRTGTCKNLVDKSIINFMYADSIEWATLWKELVESRLLLNRLAEKE